MDRKQILSAMDNDIGKSLIRFNSVAADLMNSTYIIVSGKISRLLQTVTASRHMYEFLMQATAGYNFVEQFKAAQLVDETGRAFLRVPESGNELICFAFCLLYAIDTQRVNVERLLHTYYYDIDPNTELRGFLHAVVLPFVQCLNSIFAVNVPKPEQENSELLADWTENYTPPVAAEAQQPPEEAYYGDAPAAQPDYNQFVPEQENENYAEPDSVAPALGDTQSLLSSLGEITCEIINLAANSPELTTDGREELLIVADAFNAAVGFGDFKSMRMMYVSLKNTVRCSAIAEELEDKLASIEYLMNGESNS